MRFLFINHIQNARQSIKGSKARSRLTMLGTAIGVASVTTILLLGLGAGNFINSQIEDIGGNILVVRPGIQGDALSNISRQIQPNQSYNTSTLTEEDINLISEIETVKHVAPIMSMNGLIRGDEDAPTGSTIVATDPSLAEISNLRIISGKFFTESENGKAVIGINLSRHIYGTSDSIGRLINIKGTSFTVVGIIEEFNDAINFNSIDYNNTAMISFSDGKALNKDIIQIQQINVQVNSISDLENVSKSIVAKVENSHKGQQDFSVLSGDEISSSTSELFYIVALFTSLIAGISLVVGGIGIMNIMLVTVAERTREIGIRKAIGATNADIVWQFMVESIMLSFSGGAAGFLLGYVAAAIICSSFLPFTPAISGEIIGVAAALSIAVGVIFGLYPAIRAALKDPIESLQSYS
jgi:putative ABC transport system permease protein